MDVIRRCHARVVLHLHFIHIRYAGTIQAKQAAICERAIKGATKPALIQVVGMKEIHRIGKEVPVIIPRVGEAA